jgi:nicotinate-nucleotide adenylyltransferase
VKKIGILGGTFNPIHFGHLAIAQEAQQQLGLDQVIFVPCYLPPHKDNQQLVAAKYRYVMTRLAIAGNPHFMISDFEIRKEGTSYSIDTLRYFHQVYPKGTKFFFIIGADSQQYLHTWRQIDELLKLVTFVVVTRPGQKNLKSKIRVRHVVMPGLDVSSSMIRKRVGLKQPIRYFVPDKVVQYIEKNKLY